MLKYVTLKEKELEEVFSQSTEISSKDAEGTLGTLLLYLSDFLSFTRDSSVLARKKGTNSFEAPASVDHYVRSIVE